MDTPLLKLDNIHFNYKNRGIKLLSDIYLQLMPSDRLSLSGDNGSGKSTLLNIAAGLIKADEGKIFYCGRECQSDDDFYYARQQLGYLLQNSDDQLFCSSILEDVAFGPYNQGHSLEESREMSIDILKELDLEHLADYSASRLSGGEKKIAALASILVMKPKMLFLDEPTNDLDSKAKNKLISILEERSLPLICISHDRDFLNMLCNVDYCLHEGQLLLHSPCAQGAN